MNEQVFSLRWSNHENNLCVILESMLKRGVLVDVTLSCGGKSLRVHRAILSACSPYFEELFTETDHSHPIIILKDVKPEELQALVDYMYTGQVTVSQSKLNSFLRTAESLKIRGLASAERYQENQPTNNDSCVPPRKRKRNFSFDDNQPGRYESVIQRTADEPTDLSMPKLDHCPSYIDYVAQSSSSSSSSYDATQGSSKLSVKPKEVLLHPAMSPEVVDVESEHVQENFLPTDTNTNSFPTDVQQQPEVDENIGQDASFSHHVLSDDEEPENSAPDLEVGAPVVRSGICSVCGCFRSDLRQHMESHSGQSFQCHLCGRAYPRRKTLNQHIKRSHQLYARSSQGVDTTHNDSRLRQQGINDVS